MGFSWYLCPVTVAGEQEWLLVNGEFGYVELVDTCDAEAIEQAVFDVIELHLPDGKDNVSVSFNPEHISWHTADKMPELVALRYQQALKLLDIHEDATDELEQLNDTPLTLGGGVIKEASIMSVNVKLSETLVDQAKRYALIEHRSVPKQIEYW